jgi:uncharacterized protein YbjT (DUF2867 family)
MNVLLTGANGYIGHRLLPLLLAAGHEVYCLVRDEKRFSPPELDAERVHIVQADLRDRDSLEAIPERIDAAYYLVHSMSDSAGNFFEQEQRSAENFTDRLRRTRAKQIIYLGGIANSDELSMHLASRAGVEDRLAAGGIPVTVLRSAIIIGSGSASFEILRDLVEKLPVMVAPRWVHSRCQPVAIRSVLEYLLQVLGNERAYGGVFDIGGPDIMTYRDMMLRFARVRGLRRFIVPVPVLTPRLSSYWLYFVTSTRFSLARSLVDSLKHEMICRRTGIDDICDVRALPFEEAVEQAFRKIEQNAVVSSWTDALLDSSLSSDFSAYIRVPAYGCLKDIREITLRGNAERVLDNIWHIGGHRGWYFADTLWALRGLLDKITGGVGLRRGRRSATELRAGDTLDFWRVIHADRQGRRLLLYAEMKLPGEAWLEFSIVDRDGDEVLRQEATFRPRGLLGRLYWYGIYPLHLLVFRGMARGIAGA